MHTPLKEVGVEEIPYFYYCYNTAPVLAWLITSYVYKLLLQMAAMYFAFMTRKVKIKALNDSKEIAVIIYITSLILVATVGAGFALGHSYPDAFASVVGFGRMVTATVILAMVFIPKVIYNNCC